MPVGSLKGISYLETEEKCFHWEILSDSAVNVTSLFCYFRWTDLVLAVEIKLTSVFARKLMAILHLPLFSLLLA